MRSFITSAAAAAALVLVPAQAQAVEEPLGPFGIESFATTVSTTQAGDHPDVGTMIRFSSHLSPEGFLKPNEGPANLTVEAPAGLVGSLTAVPACSTTVFATSAESFGCPDATQVGTATELFSGRGFEKTPVVLLEHGSSQLARLGIEGTLPVVVDISLRTDGDYGITATTQAIPRASVIGAGLQLWGIPAQHDRGCQTIVGSVTEGVPTRSCVPGTPASPSGQWRPFLTNPTTCAGPQPTTTLSVDSYQHPERFMAASATQAPVTNCTGLAFDPALSLTPDSPQADAPSGYTLELTVPQNEDPGGFASSTLRKASVTLPPGVTLDPSAANGLQACADAQFAKGVNAVPSCPPGSQIGTVEVISPALPTPLHGQLYVGLPNASATYRLFLNIEGEGLDVKLEGVAAPNPLSGQITASFEDLPQLPFSDFKLHLRSGSDAPLANPPICGGAVTTSKLTPWSGNADAAPSSRLAVSLDGLGTPCPSVPPFAPGFSAGSNSILAGAPTTFSLTLSRSDRTQYLGGLSVHLPPGLLGNLTRVPLCALAQAGSGTCPAASQVGTVSVEVGAGATPFTVSGRVYLAQPRTANSPASLSIVVPAIAGPYDLGTVVVGEDVRVRNDASVLVSGDPLPRILDGVPLRIRRIALDITRPGFMTNPTSCAPMSVDATVASTTAQIVDVSAPFQMADCRSLPFAPTFTVSTQAATSKANGASLDVKVVSSSGQANIAKVETTLPKQLVSRLTTLQQACPASQFTADPAGCPPASIVGVATATTPILTGPLAGPAYLVSNAAAAFPDLIVILQGQGVSVELTGNTAIRRGVTSSRFESLPDVPINTFELKLPEGPASLLAPNIPASAHRSMCAQRLTMPLQITAQNGARVTRRPRLTVTGCPNHSHAKRTRARRPASQWRLR